MRRPIESTHFSGNPGDLNGSTQHFLVVYSPESENLKFVVGVDLSAALLCSDPTLLKNPFYIGRFYWSEKLYQGTHVPIVSFELFDRVQDAFRAEEKIAVCK